MAPEGYRVTLENDRTFTVARGEPGSPPYSKEVAEAVARVFNEKAPLKDEGPWVIESVGDVPVVIDKHPWLDEGEKTDPSPSTTDLS
ncbi:hypothetical protein A2Z22_03175 [Candidatus Woesebacteria bacterium RBG_16_34_12]|uniref:Uncharacterized protein n=1 Tax=Candidatus Woesebacteria bacterium RBG_16_34_12 TaxID=1802480 RepID=A0A1F7XAL3_9BACT|nr:MAG: hypothetical protein A2Z22_03175 [Candidatus Woesebacteria bacterium RBG_16_34_12]